jgi:ribosomal protein L15E
MKNYWLSWYATRESGPWKLDSPWWVSGWRFKPGSDEIEEPTICAAVRADSEAEAKEIVMRAHDRRPDTIKWRFCEERPSGWSPFHKRFPRAKWMQWPAETGAA